MTLDEFLEEMSKYEWHLSGFCDNEDGVIRSEELPYYCPLTYIAKKKGESFCNVEFIEAGKFLGLTLEDSVAIAFAADDSKEAGIKLRKRMLDIVRRKQ